MMKYHILVVDDEEDILELVRYNLGKEGWSIKCLTTGEDCLRAVENEKPDLIILDLMLPGLSGLEVCGHLKADAKFSKIPIIMLTAKGEESDIVSGLELGADDYITKPFIPRILVARVRAVLRRQPRTEEIKDTILKHDGLTIDPSRHEVKLAGDQIDVTATEFKLLFTMARQPGRVFTRSQIIKAVHGDNYPVTDRSIDVQVVGLRRKLKSYDHLIETVRGVGYRFKDLSATSE